MLAAPGSAPAVDCTYPSAARKESSSSRTTNTTMTMTNINNNITNLAASLEAPQDPEEKWWWTRCAPLFFTLLNASGAYTPGQMADHMRVVREVVIPTLGPRPSKALVTPLLTLDGSPFEPSWNFQRKQSIVRYAFEPLWDMGKPGDPFGGRQMMDFMRVLAKVSSPDTDLGWFEQIWARWSVLGEDATKAKEALMAHGQPASVRVPQMFLALDHKGGERRLKSYHLPILKHLATGISTEQLLIDMIEELQPVGSAGSKEMQGAMVKLKLFFATTKYPAAVEMVSIDCVKPELARIKIYARTKTNSLATVRETLTLAGLQTDEQTMAGVARAERIWHLLLDERNGMAEEQSKEMRHKMTHHTGTCFVLEIRPGSDRVSVKPQMPWCQTNGSDGRGAENFASVLRLLGWEDQAERFERGVMAAAALPGQNYATETGGLSYLAYEHNKGGDYISSYFSPRCQADHGLD